MLPIVHLVYLHVVETANGTWWCEGDNEGLCNHTEHTSVRWRDL